VVTSRADRESYLIGMLPALGYVAFGGGSHRCLAPHQNLHARLRFLSSSLVDPRTLNSVINLVVASDCYKNLMLYYSLHLFIFLFGKYVAISGSGYILKLLSDTT
jgi:hypothetical protein